MKCVLFLLFLCLICKIGTEESTQQSRNTQHKNASSQLNNNELHQYQEIVLDMFYHGYNNYMQHAFPLDELMPISCSGHDTLGSYHLTLIDTLDMLAVIGNFTEFEKQVKWVISNVHFTKDKNISLFETNIRILGSLLSSHLLSETYLEGYPWDGKSLLDLAKEMGDILIKAFDTPTGIPYGTVNCADGGFVPPGEVKITSVACSTTYTLEFGLLSRLLNDPKYEKAATRAVESVWERRSKYNLLGNHINIETGDWTASEATIGGNVDSFYEYLIKASILFGDRRQLEIFLEAYKAVLEHLLDFPFYKQVDYNTKALLSTKFESLTAFWPGMQALIGDLSMATVTMHAFHSIWKSYGFVPEAYNYAQQSMLSARQYPLRPEMAESLFYLHSITNDTIWVEYGKEIVNSLNSVTRVECGFAAVEDIPDRRLRDHMDSFFLSETCKYLYLLFTPNHPFISSQYVFNTEGHPFPIRYEWLKDKENHAIAGKCSDLPIVEKIANRDFQPSIDKYRHVSSQSRFDSMPFIPFSNINANNDNNDNNDNDTPRSSVNNNNNAGDVTGGENEKQTLNLETSARYAYILHSMNEVKIIGSVAQFGEQNVKVSGEMIIADPILGCSEIFKNTNEMKGKIVLLKRGQCEFTTKVFNSQKAGAVAAIIFDSEKSMYSLSISMFGNDEGVVIPSLFISRVDGEFLIENVDSLGVVSMELMHDVDEDSSIVSVQFDAKDITLENIEERIRDSLPGVPLTTEQIATIREAILKTIGAEDTPVVGKEVYTDTCIDGDCSSDP